ncbi:MAG: ornithine cyclodeaminase family protein [Inquilinus limosus]|uniref:Ornithine cyclodeaminase family protein n=1 Tax=Inquilinus limosus TaxID=171674 RepID=A0A952KFY2_9PROT|nr:ornithine cyclodeaminase family protein [Inquilinus limosus]
MLAIDAAALDRAIDTRALIEALRQAFRREVEAPLRHHHTVPTEAGDATLLIMPAWEREQAIGIKLVSLMPGNPAKDLPFIVGSYLLLDGATGVPRAIMDGPTLTNRRTAAASALAADYLARPDASRMVMVGAGALAPHFIRAHAAVRPLADIAIWARRPEQAADLAKTLAAEGLPVRAVTDLEAAVRDADIVSCATQSRQPIVHGAWLRPGAHLDLAGAYLPAMRESDDEAVRRARIFVDTRAGALAEAGDLLQPIRAGVIGADAILADLHDLTRGTAPGRGSPDEITLFKSVGTALEDLAAARLAVETLEGQES